MLGAAAQRLVGLFQENFKKFEASENRAMLIAAE